MTGTTSHPLDRALRPAAYTYTEKRLLAEGDYAALLDRLGVRYRVLRTTALVLWGAAAVFFVAGWFTEPAGSVTSYPGGRLALLVLFACSVVPLIQLRTTLQVGRALADAMTSTHPI